MKIPRFIPVVIVALSIMFISQKNAQAQRRGMRYAAPRFDTTTVETIKGTVESIEKMRTRARRSYGYGVHVMLDTGSEVVPVHLGPSWYLDKQKVKIEKGDEIEVTGSRITYNEKPALVAAIVTKGDEVLNLRDERGFPLWSGWKNR